MTRYDKYNTFSAPTKTTKEHKLSTLVKDGLLNQLKQMVAWLAKYNFCFVFCKCYPELAEDLAGSRLTPRLYVSLYVSLCISLCVSLCVSLFLYVYVHFSCIHKVLWPTL